MNPSKKFQKKTERELPTKTTNRDAAHILDNFNTALHVDSRSGEKRSTFNNNWLRPNKGTCELSGDKEFELNIPADQIDNQGKVKELCFE